MENPKDNKNRSASLLVARTPKLSSKQQKIDWLLAHQDMWEGWPRGAHGSDSRHAEIVRAMRKDGLVSAATGFWDICLTRLIGDARNQRRRRNHAA